MLGTLSIHDAAAQLTTFKSYLNLIADNTPGIVEKKLKAANELSENFESVVNSPQYPVFLADAINVFLKILDEGKPQFILEQNMQHLRKVLLEIIHRIPSNDHLKRFVHPIVTLMFKLLAKENEDNVLVCIRIILELHKSFRPQMNDEVQAFLNFVKHIYTTLPMHLPHIFLPRSQRKVKDMSEINVETWLDDIYTVTPVLTDKKTSDNQSITYNIIPRGNQSLKVLAELPIIVVLMYQLYKSQVQPDMMEFIPLIMNTITLQPTPQSIQAPGFNKEVFVDFIAAQIKTLSFLAYIIKIYQSPVNTHYQQMVQGLLGLLRLCPQEVAHLRKELLVAARHILSTDLRNKFVPVIDQLFDEVVLIGAGWTTQDSLRPLAYSTLADLVHHIRQSLPLLHLSLAVNLFSKNVHDESLPATIQTMSCKLLLNLVECIRLKSEQENGNGRALLIRMFEVFVLKCKTIAKVQLPRILKKCKQTPQSSSSSNNAIHVQSTSNMSTFAATSSSGLQLAQIDKPGSLPMVSSSNGGSVFASVTALSAESSRGEDKLIAGTHSPTEDKAFTNRFGVSPSQFSIYSISDCRCLVKTVICGVKTIIWGIIACKQNDAATPSLVANKQFDMEEILVFSQLVRHALVALDVYTINISANGQAYIRPAAVQSVRMKEEKEVLEHFGGVFTLLSPAMFREIFSTNIEFLVERINQNYALQIIANSFLSNPSTSSTFATLLINFLLSRMEEMGSNIERSNLYLKMHKLVFGSVSLFAAENEQMLKPHLHRLVNRSMELALSAKDPYNYFLLLRGLFRSIGGGSHDLLYQEFLPLLPTLLQGLNSLQSGLHRQYMKDLFVELCLTVPVRLSSLLPYLPLLMDPLVSALNGSQTLVSQGLRTLELCVDNLQPDFLYDHIQPVKAELMQALWRTLRSPQETISNVAFRVLGKFGGGNRKMLREPQQLSYNVRETVGPCISISFVDCKQSISLPVEKAIDIALATLKSTSSDIHHRRQAWDVIRCFLVSVMNLDDDRNTMMLLFTHPSFTEKDILSSVPNAAGMRPPLYVNPDAHSRKVHEQALTGMFVAAAVKELHSSAVHFMACMVRHYTMVAVSQQAGPFATSDDKVSNLQGMDTQILVDALAVIMGHEEKELCKPGTLALVLMVETATTILGSKERACQLPIFEYLVEKMCSLCYDRAWYAKYGGCHAIKFMYERMSLKWVLEHQFTFVRALFFVIMDLTSESTMWQVSNGAIDQAKINLQSMLAMCAATLPDDVSEDLKTARQQSLNDVTHELVRQITSPITLIRETAMSSLLLLAEKTNISVTKLMEPHKEVLQDMIPPKKHLLRHQPLNAQIGLMEGNTFCTALEPRLFTMDVSIVEHNVFFTELCSLCEAEDSMLLKLPCYKNVTNPIPLRQSALKALAACHYIVCRREKIFRLLYKTLNSANTELLETAFECISTFTSAYTPDVEMVSTSISPFLASLQDVHSLTMNAIRRLSFLIKLFPYVFDDKFCETLQSHLKTKLDLVTLSQKTGQPLRPPGHVLSTDMEMSAAILDVFHMMPAATSKMLDSLVSLVLSAERMLMTEAGSPLREPLLRFLLRCPMEAVNFFLTVMSVKNQQYSRCLVYCLRHSDGRPFRQALESAQERLLMFLQTEPDDGKIVSEEMDVQFQAVNLISVIIKFTDNWLSSQPAVLQEIVRIWTSSSFVERHQRVDSLDHVYWKEPLILVKCLLSYFRNNTHEIKLLFHILRCFTDRFLYQFLLVKEFLDDVVAVTYSVEWKRQAFFTFVEVFHDAAYPQDLKAKILQHILIPSFHASFECGDGDQLVGGPPAPEQDDDSNIISYFINRVIDPDNLFGTSDAVCILLLQFSSLLVEQASSHIHDATNKKQGNKLRRLMKFAWPCLLSKNCVDPATKYHGHLLLAHVIAKFAIHKRIVLQVFHSLLKAHAPEAKAVVRQALEILTPSMPSRMEDGNGMLNHWTKKIIVEEGHSVGQLTHILSLVVRHYRIYYPVRHSLIQHMISSLSRLGFAQSSSIEHRKLAVDLVDVIIKWEIERIKEGTETEVHDITFEMTANAETETVLKRQSAAIDGSTDKRPRHIDVATAESSKCSPESNRALDKHHCEAVVNFLLRMACQVNESSSAVGSQGEQLSRRCVALVKVVLKPDMWLGTELKMSWLEKVLASVQSHQPNFNNICTALELLTYLLTILKCEQILATFKPLQKSISLCMQCGNNKVIRSVHSLLSKLTSHFPTEASSSNVASKYEELESLYATVSKVIYEGLTSYEKAATGSSSQLFSTLMILKAACQNNVAYIDRLITTFMKVMSKMAREHLSPTTQEAASSVATELLILALDLVKNRVGVMSQEMKKSFIHLILVQLIDKSPDNKVVRAITKMVEDWVKLKTQREINQSPQMKDKTILLVRLMNNVERRFNDDQELVAQFLKLVNYIYRESLNQFDSNPIVQSDLTSKLEPAFLAGLRCSQPSIRQKFVEVFHASIPSQVFHRILYMTCSQNWEHMGTHYWIKQCIEHCFSSTCFHDVAFCSPELVFPPHFLKIVVEVRPLGQLHDIQCGLDGPVLNNEIQSSSPMNLLLSASSVVNMADSLEQRAMFADNLSIKEDSMDVESVEQVSLDIKEEEIEKLEKKLEMVNVESSSQRQNLRSLIQRQCKFLQSCKETKTSHYLTALIQLGHFSTELSHSTWLDLFPRLWGVLTDKHQQTLSVGMTPFVCSGSHVVQKNCQPSAIHTFVAALTQCRPPVSISHVALKYLGSAHNLWHRACLSMEDIVHGYASTQTLQHRVSNELEFVKHTDGEELEVTDALCQLYWQMREEDMWAGLFSKRTCYAETNTAILFEQHGHFEQAQYYYETVMNKARIDSITTPISPAMQPECHVWEEHWIRCAKELNQWDQLLEYGNNKGFTNSYLVLDSAWRVPQWNTMKEALFQVCDSIDPSKIDVTSYADLNCPKEMAWKVHLFRGYIAICHPDEHHLNLVERIVEQSSSLAIKEWRRLPSVVSHIHVPLLQAAQQIMELQEAMQINQVLQPSHIGRTSSFHEMKAIVKTWKNRLPMVSDSLSHWSDICVWRQHHYQCIVNYFNPQSQSQQDQANSNSMLGVHASVQGIIHFGKIARKHGLTNVALETLSRIHTIPTVPIVDCYQKIRQQVKCFLQMAGVSTKSELSEGLEVIESTNLKFFTKDMVAEFYAMKGLFLSLMNRSDDANKAFSAAVCLHDTQVKAWALWGEYMEDIFVRDKDMVYGEYAITCYLHACRHQNESKSRKYLAKVLWLMTYDDATCCLANAVDKYQPGVPPIQWLPWIPQLLTCLVHNEGKVVMNLLTLVGRTYPQAVYFPIRTLYLTLKAEQRERHKSGGGGGGEILSGTSQLTVSNPNNAAPQTITSTPTDLVSTLPSFLTTSPATSQLQTSIGCSPGSTSDPGPIKAPAPMWRCSRIMHTQREFHPTILASLEGIVDQMVWFRESWYEEVQQQLRQGLAKCYTVAFENNSNVGDAMITPHTLNFVNKLVSMFGVGVENMASMASANSSAACEPLAQRAQATLQDPMFRRMKSQFMADFDFSVPGSKKLYNLISKLKKWIKILEAKSQTLPKSFLLEEKCRFLSNFSLSTAEVELPGEFLLPKPSHYYTRIARFMPRVEIVHKHDTAARRLSIRGHNGKIYPYLVVNDPCMTESRREERVLQLLRMSNHFLVKHKETCRRLLYFTVPRVVALSPQMRLVEDNRASVSLLDIYKTLMTQLALVCFAEYALHLTRLDADQMYLHQDCGYLSIAYFKFCLDDDTGDLDSHRPVPFRLTPTVAEFLTPTGISGPLTAGMIAAARCLVQPQYKAEAFLRAILRDEYITWNKKRQEERNSAVEPKDMDGETLVAMVNKAVNMIMTRIQNMATFENADTSKPKVVLLVLAATNNDNLCRMDPAWHPWL